jgi:hypothetical protein
MLQLGFASFPPFPQDLLPRTSSSIRSQWGVESRSASRSIHDARHHPVHNNRWREIHLESRVATDRSEPSDRVTIGSSLVMPWSSQRAECYDELSTAGR